MLNLFLIPLSSVNNFKKTFPLFKTFITQLQASRITKKVDEACSHPEWKKAMDADINALNKKIKHGNKPCYSKGRR